MKYIGFPRPSYPLAHIVEPHRLSFLQMFYKEKKRRSCPVLIFDKENSRLRFQTIKIYSDNFDLRIISNNFVCTLIEKDYGRFSNQSW